ncbi:MAG: hypothetical protein AABY32_01345 [Nanoarchaeota archaeon]
MNLYLIKNPYYSPYCSAVVCAKNEKSARLIHPDGYEWQNNKKTWNDMSAWCNPENVIVEYLGKARKGMKSGVIEFTFDNS